MPPDTSTSEREFLGILKAIPGWHFDYTKDLTHIRTLATDYPTVNLLEEVKKAATWLLDKPLKRNANPRLFLRNWMKNSLKYSRKGGQPRGATTDYSEFEL